MKSNDILLVDTCAIIEACRTGCWNAISKNFRVETVDECIVEAQTGKAQRIYPPIPEQELRAAFHKVYTVSEIDRATFELKSQKASRNLTLASETYGCMRGKDLTLGIFVGQTKRA